MSKKILALCLVVVLAITAVTGATLAYFNDTEAATNVFTLGNVVIDLVEEQRTFDEDGKGTGLEEFDDRKVLLPIVGSAQDDNKKEEVGGYNLPTAANWVDKIITVDNEGTQDAYVRVLLAFPAKMDDASSTNMLMHWNSLREEPDDIWDRKGGDVQITLDNEKYNVYNFTYMPILTAEGTTGDTTSWPAMVGLYIDERVNATVAENGDITYSMTLANNTVKSATYAAGTAPKLYVLTQGVQEAGFANADEALTAGFGEVTKDNAQAWFDAIVTDDRADID